MKKMMLTLVLLASAMMVFAQVSADTDFSTVKESVAITAAFTRNLDGKTFVKEIKLENFSTKPVLPPGFGLKGATYADNGKNNDKMAGDGLYTSIEKFEITEKQAGNAVGVSVLVLDKIVVDNSFKYEEQLSNGLYKMKVLVKCNLHKCGCPCRDGGTCPACQWWGWSCWTFDVCTVEVGFD